MDLLEAGKSSIFKAKVYYKCTNVRKNIRSTINENAVNEKQYSIATVSEQLHINLQNIIIHNLCRLICAANCCEGKKKERRKNDDSKKKTKTLQKLVG